MKNDDDDRGGIIGQAKILPEWNVAADDQIVLAGLAVVAAMLGIFGWNAWRSGDEPAEIVAAVTTVEATETVVDDPEEPAAVVPAPVEEETTTTEAPTTTEAAAVIGEVQPAVDPFPGDITGTNDGAVAVLTGYVANDAESKEAEDAAAAVEGIERVDNQLVILEPQVESALTAEGVRSAGAAGVGTVITATGTLESEDDRAPTLAAAKVEGVTEVIDELDVSVTADLNALPQVQFATGSAVILEESFPDLDAAATLLLNAPEAKVEVQGYTDIRGDEAANLQLSEDRSNAVRDYLLAKGVDEANLTAQGFGETEQFGAGETDEALAANRLVRFEDKS